MLYKIREDMNINDLVDGRTTRYLSKKMGCGRELLSLILRGKTTCDYDRAIRILDACEREGDVLDYFVEVKKEG